MRVALYIYIRTFEKQMSCTEEDVDGISREILNYDIEQYENASGPIEPHSVHENPISPQTDSLNSDVPSSNTESEGKHQFTCGNPDVQTIHGVMHFFNDITKCGDGYKSDLVCILSIPAMFNLLDILNFLGPYNTNINGIRIIKDRNPHSYMVLVRFLDCSKADEFYINHQDRPYNALDDALCHLAFVTAIEWGATEVDAKSLAAGPLTELPQCAVCLERMDESTTGMLTVLCNHSFHCDCMTKCTTCPVCRYFAVPPEQSQHCCMVCGNTEGLWLCLICGYVGCGRYEGGHARGHFERTNHTYSMDVEQRCVWDYVGDNYVHRLIQNKTDGKLVAVQGQDGMMDEKLESLTLEYSYLLTQQLESQRDYFEKKLLFVEEEAMERIVSVEGEIQKIAEQKDSYKSRFEDNEKETRKSQKRLETLTTKYTAMAKELSEERELNNCLRDNQKGWVEKVVVSGKALESACELHRSEVEDLKDQIKDLMFHFQSQDTINSSSMKDEIQAGDLHTVQGPSNEPRTRRSPRKKK